MQTLPVATPTTDAMDVEEKHLRFSVPEAPSEEEGCAKPSFKELRRHSSPAPSGPPAFSAHPTPEEERDFILHAMSEPLRPSSSTVFLISMGWWNAWRAYVGLDHLDEQPESTSSTRSACPSADFSLHGATSTSSTTAEGRRRPGPINNLTLCPQTDCPSLMDLCSLRVLVMHEKRQIDIDLPRRDDLARDKKRDAEQAPLLNQEVLEHLENFRKDKLRRALCRGREIRSGLVEGRDCVAITLSAWRALWSWYGGGPVIPRPVVGIGLKQRTKVELYPVTLLVLPLNNGRLSDRDLQRFTFSPTDQLKAVRHVISSRFLLPPHKINMHWHYDYNSRTGTLCNTSSVHLVDLDQTVQDLGLADGCLLSLHRAPLHFGAAAVAPPAQGALQLAPAPIHVAQHPSSSPSQPL